MKKSLVSFLTIVTVACSLTITSFADTLNNKALNNDKVQYNQISSEIKNLDSNIRNLNNEIDTLNNTINQNKSKISSIEKNIGNATVQIDDTKAKIAKGQDVLSNRLSAIYKSGSYSPAAYLIYIMQADGFSQLLSRIYDVQRIVSMDDQLINGLKANKASIEKEIDSLNKQKQEIVALNDQTQQSLNTVVQKQNTVTTEKAKLNTQLQDIASTITANEQQLVNYPISVINNSSSSISDLKNAVQTLKDLLPQITMQSVVSTVNNAISKGNSSIQAKQAAQAEANKPPTTGGNSSSSGGSSSSGSSNPGSPSTGQFKEKFSMEATAYSGDGITAMGTATVRNPNGISTVAVDPSVIPLGSKLYIPGYGYAIAADTGGAIKGHKIDLFMNTNAECNAFGRRQITVYLVALPGQW